MDLLLEAKMAAPPVDSDRERGSARQILDVNGQAATGTGANSGKARSSADDPANGDSAVKQWVKDVGGAATGNKQVVREGDSKTDGGQRATRQRANSDQEADNPGPPSAFGQAIMFIRENRVVMLMLCAIVLILAGAAFVYSSKGSNGSRGYDR